MEIIARVSCCCRCCASLKLAHATPMPPLPPPPTLLAPLSPPPPPHPKHHTTQHNTTPTPCAVTGASSSDKGERGGPLGPGAAWCTPPQPNSLLLALARGAPPALPASSPAPMFMVGACHECLLWRTNRKTGRNKTCKEQSGLGADLSPALLIVLVFVSFHCSLFWRPWGN